MARTINIGDMLIFCVPLQFERMIPEGCQQSFLQGPLTDVRLQLPYIGWGCACPRSCVCACPYPGPGQRQGQKQTQKQWQRQQRQRQEELRRSFHGAPPWAPWQPRSPTVVALRLLLALDFHLDHPGPHKREHAISKLRWVLQYRAPMAYLCTIVRIAVGHPYGNSRLPYTEQICCPK